MNVRRFYIEKLNLNMNTWLMLVILAFFWEEIRVVLTIKLRSKIYQNQHIFI